MKRPEPTLSLPVMNEDAYEQKILKFLSENPRDMGCVQTIFSDRSGAHSERILFYSWLDPHADVEIARNLAQHIDRTREAWESVMVTMRDLPPPMRASGSEALHGAASSGRRHNSGSLRLPWTDVSAVVYRKRFGLPYFHVKRRRGFSWWIPLYYVGDGDLGHAIIGAAPHGHPFKLVSMPL
jgi:hypothetical protein